MALLEIATVVCALTCQVQMRDGSVYDVQDRGSFKEGDFVELSLDRKTLCRPICPIVPVVKVDSNIYKDPKDQSVPQVRGLW